MKNLQRESHRLLKPSSNLLIKHRNRILKDITDFINFKEKKQRSRRKKCHISASMVVTSLFTNIPQEERITTVCKVYEGFYGNEPPIPSRYLKEMLVLILKEINSTRKKTLQGTAMGMKMAFAIANILIYGNN